MTTFFYLLDIFLYVRMRGGVVVVDRLPRDSQGTLLVSLDRWDITGSVHLHVHLYSTVQVYTYMYTCTLLYKCTPT